MKLDTWKKWQNLIETDMLENDEMEINLDKGCDELLFEPFEIRTFRMLF